ncbi:class I SAM-dependent methyltransferase [Cytophagales bacterium LB-30]|uniref:Class I SAM-dependent methyltransferase n=1 Tax=Shiella aurantiaca TaxID=3058365 RepID=A0ABT8F6Q6_9BACT|nr:class I SAM-dependent methyltransferase [Shiella aurantiaca]MDN4166054.1 class I SAM-dependent methyltransferase [Shiella aurantiaca]
MSTEWFGQWFNSPYYHILYQHRDEKEAQHFIDTLQAALLFQPGDRVMDLACGKGRHSIYLHSKGMEVWGLDLSEQNIAYAQRFASEGLHFVQHDMREVYQKETFQCIFNLFTSFGYFDDEADNLAAIKAMYQSLKPGGCALIDFLNPHVVINRLVPEEVKLLDGIEFHIQRSFENGFIRKRIWLEDQGTQHQFEERVRAISYEDFLHYFEQAGFTLSQVWGDYQLNAFQKESSERMIFLIKKSEQAPSR